VPLVIWVVRDRPTERDGLHYLAAGDRRHVHAHPHAGSGTGGPRWRDIFRRTNFILLIATYLPMLALYGACLNNLAPIATSRGLTQQTAGVLLSLFSLSQVSATLLAGILSDRFGNRIPLSGLAMATAIGGVVVALCQDIVSLAVGVVLVAMSGGMWPILAAAVAKEFGASGVGRAFGLLMVFLPVIGLAPFAIARIQELTTSYAPGLLALAALALGGALACLFIREPQGWRADEEPAASGAS
jgi:DHA2 family metal-tetracycline-proton antiporter-like MFS transporter